MSNAPQNRQRRRLMTATAGALLAAPALVRAVDLESLRIGYQKSSTLTIWLKSKGVLEKALASLNVQVSWHEFASGLPLLEALNVGAIDLSADVADAVPPFALAAGARVSYYASESPSARAQAIVVKADSSVRSVAQLKGQKVAFAKGAGAHYLVLEALRKAGLTIKDIEPAYLSPADGRAAFENGSVAAWVIWDPFLAAVQRQSNARVLLDGEGLSAYRRFYLAATPYANRRADVLAVVYAELQRAGIWIKTHPAARLNGTDPSSDSMRARWKPPTRGAATGCSRWTPKAWKSSSELQMHSRQLASFPARW